MVVHPIAVQNGTFFYYFGTNFTNVGFITSGYGISNSNLNNNIATCISN